MHLFSRSLTVFASRRRHGAKKRKFSGTPLWMLEQKNKMPKAGGGEEEAGEADEWVLVRLEF